MGLFKRRKNTEAAAGNVAAEQAGADAAVQEGADAGGTAAGEGAAEAPDGELIAVIAAAIAAYEAEQNRRSLCIRKLNRAAGARPAWGVTGTMEAIDMRRM